MSGAMPVYTDRIGYVIKECVTRKSPVLHGRGLK
jgi:hypothetical protein